MHARLTKNILTIDDGCPGISYRKSKVDNDMNVSDKKTLFEEAYKTMLDAYDNYFIDSYAFNESSKIASDLYDIYGFRHKVVDSAEMKRLNCIGPMFTNTIYGMTDFSDFISLIDEADNETVYSRFIDLKNLVFLKIKYKYKTPSEKDFDICIAIKNNMHKSMMPDSWNKYTNKVVELPDESKKHILANNTLEITETVRTVVPAVNNEAYSYCESLCIDNNGTIYKGYLPTSRQLYYLANNVNIVNWILKNYGYSRIDMGKRLWCCDNHEGVSAFIWDHTSILFGRTQHMDLLPFFKSNEF